MQESSQSKHFPLLFHTHSKSPIFLCDLCWLLHQVLCGNIQMKYDVIGVYNVRYFLPYYWIVCVKVGESFHASGRSCDPPGCCHITANVTRSELASAGEPLPPFKSFLLPVSALAPCSVTQLSARIPLLHSPGTGTRTDFLLWMTTALTRTLSWHQPVQNNTRVIQCSRGANLHVPSGSPG